MTRPSLGAILSLALVAPLAADNWPGFRGVNGQGQSPEKDLPTRWTATENIAWKTPIPGDGWSSPIVWGDRVFVTTAAEKGTLCHVLCLDRRTGKVLWDRELFRQETGPKRPKNSYATPTPVTDGERVYAVFGDGSLVALDFAGQVIWMHREVKFYSQHGLGASPILYRDLLIMPFDGSNRGEDKILGFQKPWDQSFILALDKHTGRERWRGRRGLSRIAHVTPVIHAAAGTEQLISPAGDNIQGFDPATGERLWSVFSQGEGVVPTPVLFQDLIITGSGFEKPTIRTVRPRKEGAGWKAEIAWEQTRNVSMIPSPVLAGEHLFMVTEKGIAQCLRADTGEQVWQERLGGAGYSSSPLHAAGKVYFLSENGETTVIEAGPAFRELARNPLGEFCQATPAASQGQLFIRSDKHLWCIGK